MPPGGRIRNGAEPPTFYIKSTDRIPIEAVSKK
jgi:hypothetical protein